MTVETEVAALTTAVNSLTSSVNVSKATLDESIAAAAAIYDSFDDRYLGVKSSAPSTDNDGGALLTGALYFSDTTNTMNVFTGSAWAPVANNNIINPNVALTQDLATNGNDVKFGDNDKATFGASNDLQIYHDGSSSYVSDTGAGPLRLQGSGVRIVGTGGENLLIANEAAEVTLLHNNAAKLATTATGIDVTGSVVANGLTVDGKVTFGGYSPTVLYDFNNSGTVTSADALAYAKLGGGVSTGVDISAAPVLTTSWSAPTGAVYADNKFRILAAKGNSTDTLLVAGANSASGYGDTIVIGNVDVNGVNTKLITGLGIDGSTLTLAGNVTATGTLAVTDAIAANGGLDVTGTATMDGLVVDGDGLIQASTGAKLEIKSTINFINPNDVVGSLDFVSADYNHTAQPIKGQIRSVATHPSGTGDSALFLSTTETTNLKDRIKVDYNGDISFYEDTGTTAKLFWDASAESLGIGTSSPTDLLNISGSSNQIGLDTGDQATYGTLDIGHFINGAFIGTQAGSNAASNILRLGTSGSERMRIDSAGNLTVTANSASSWATTIQNGTQASAHGLYVNAPSTSSIPFRVDGGGSERMRIDSAGNLLVGKTSAAIGTEGVQLESAGSIAATRSGGNTARFNRLASDGDVVQFQKDGTTVGSIGTIGNNSILIGSGDVNIRFNDTDNMITPSTSIGANNDNVLNLGHPSVRFKDLYLSGGVYLGGTGAANLLDDYEEGTWTPTVGAQIGSVTAYTASGTFVRVGATVTLTVYVTLGNVGTASGVMLITNVPFSTVAYANGMARENANTGYVYSSALNLAAGIQINNATNGPISWTNGNVYTTTITYKTNA